MAKVPYMLVVGEEEASVGTISARKRGEGDLGTFAVEAFAAKVTEEIKQMLSA